MARPIASTVLELQALGETKPGFQFEALPEDIFRVEDMTPGMVTSIPREKRSPGSGLEVFNARSRPGRLEKRPGHRIYIVKPNASKVLHLTQVEPDEDAVWIIRLTQSSIHGTRTTDGWIAFGGPTLAGTISFVDSVQFIDRLAIATKANRIIIVDPTTQSYQFAPDSPLAKSVANFGDRVVAVAGVTFYWSENADPLDWTGPGSGLEQLISGEGGAGDDISRVFGFETVAILLRQRSIWHVTRQPFQVAPFRFTPVIDNQGSDLPESAVKLPDGIIFADRRARGVFFYSPGSRPERISLSSEDDIMADIDAADDIGSTFDPSEDEYHLDLRRVGTLNPVITWVYRRKNGSWLRDAGATKKTSAIAPLPDVGDPIVINEVLTTINTTPGTINSYATLKRRHFIFRGRETGEVLIQHPDENQDFDEPVGGGALAVQDFDMVFTSQDLGSVSQRRTIKDTLLDIEVELTGITEQIVIQHSRDGGVTFKNTKTVSAPVAGRQELGLRKKQLTGNRLFWQLKARTRVKLFGYWVRVLEKGMRKVGKADAVPGG